MSGIFEEDDDKEEEADDSFRSDMMVFGAPMPLPLTRAQIDEAQMLHTAAVAEMHGFLDSLGKSQLHSLKHLLMRIKRRAFDLNYVAGTIDGVSVMKFGLSSLSCDDENPLKESLKETIGEQGGTNDEDEDQESEEGP